MVAASGAVTVEVLGGDATVDEVASGRTGRANVARGRDVVGRHGVTESRQHSCVQHVLDLARLHGESVEVGRELHVGRSRLPVVGELVGRRHRLPTLVAAEGARVAVLEHLGGDRCAHRLGDLRVTRPEVGQHHRCSVGVGTERLGREVDVDGARQGVGDHQRWTSEEVLLHVGVDATFEVAVSRQHRHARKVVFVDRLGHALEQRSGVTDARRAAVAREVEAQIVQRLDERGTL